MKAHRMGLHAVPSSVTKVAELPQPHRNRIQAAEDSPHRPGTVRASRSLRRPQVQTLLCTRHKRGEVEIVLRDGESTLFQDNLGSGFYEFLGCSDRLPRMLWQSPPDAIEGVVNS